MELMTETDSTGERRSPRSKAFMDLIVAYNNSLSFTTEMCGQSDAQWSHFRIQGSLHHMIPPLMPEKGIAPRFLQIYHLDASQEQLDARMEHVAVLDRGVLRTLQRTLKQVNPYVQGFKQCSDRLKDCPPDTTGRVLIHQVDPTHHQQGTHNLPTSREVATVIIGTDAPLEDQLERDIVVQTHEGALARKTFYWSE